MQLLHRLEVERGLIEEFVALGGYGFVQGGVPLRFTAIFHKRKYCMGVKEAREFAENP
jgi:hypothetical protein